MLLCKQEEAGFSLMQSKLIGKMTLMMMNWKIRNWKRIICIWHKFNRFLQMLLTLDLSLMMNHCKREEINQDDDDNDLSKESNNTLFETNNLLYADYKKSEAELARRNSKEYASQMELESAKVRGDLLSYKMDYQKSCTKYTDTINALNQTILEMKDKLSAHQETISILSKQKEAQIKLYKTREDKELDKVIELENKVK
nr:hypothetical protein [Tanacetum cinerariifolium]